MEIVLQNREAYVKKWLNELQWKSIATSFIAGMLVLAFGFGFMSESTHEKRATASMQEVLRPYLARDCAAQVRASSDYETLRATLLSKKDSVYETRQAIPENLTTLPGNRWADDKVAADCAALILNPPIAKAAALKPAETRSN